MHEYDGAFRAFGTGRISGAQVTTPPFAFASPPLLQTLQSATLRANQWFLLQDLLFILLLRVTTGERVFLLHTAKYIKHHGRGGVHQLQ